MAFVLSERSRERLRGVHPDLVRVVERAIQISPLDFTITEGTRSLERQKQLVAKGASKTMNSRHLKASNGYSHAIDFAAVIDGEVRWDWPLYTEIAKAFKKAAKELGIAIEWGGDWKSFKDGPHIQLPFKPYPATGPVKAPIYTGETDKAAKAKGAAFVAAGVGSAAPLATEPVAKAVEALTSQQDELTSGDVTRIVLAVVIVGLASWLAWRKLA